jgi:hypothetical protein
MASMKLRQWLLLLEHPHDMVSKPQAFSPSISISTSLSIELHAHP